MPLRPRRTDPVGQGRWIELHALTGEADQYVGQQAPKRLACSPTEASLFGGQKLADLFSARKDENGSKQSVCGRSLGF